MNHQIRNGLFGITLAGVLASVIGGSPPAVSLDGLSLPA
jgi:hypothetical protein